MCIGVLTSWLSLAINHRCSVGCVQVVKAGDSTTFDVVFLARVIGAVQNTLYIHTSLGTFDYKVRTYTVHTYIHTYIHVHTCNYSSTPLFQEKLLVIVFQAFEHPFEIIILIMNTYTLRSLNQGCRRSTSLQQSLRSYSNSYRTSSSLLQAFSNIY